MKSIKMEATESGFGFWNSILTIDGTVEYQGVGNSWGQALDRLNVMLAMYLEKDTSSNAGGDHG